MGGDGQEVAGERSDAHQGGSLLAQISTEMVHAMKHHYGKGPVSAKSYLVDDLLFVVMRDMVTQAERTMLDAGRGDTVREFRQQFENEVAETLTGLVERVTGRRVLTYQSQVLFDPDITVEIFVFEDRRESDETDGDGGGAGGRGGTAGSAADE
jgi:uncharacterized protein YbcI